MSSVLPTSAFLPTGTVTFLFTDIEGSTQLLQTLRENYAFLLAEHLQLLRAAIAQYQGYVIDSQGDAYCLDELIRSLFLTAN
jgi:class 3 adenylate cyclase